VALLVGEVAVTASGMSCQRVLIHWRAAGHLEAYCRCGSDEVEGSNGVILRL
jgi:hypothetical protein